MRQPALGLNSSLFNGSSLLKRIGENLQSVWKLPWAPLPATNVPIHLLDDQRSRTTPAAQLGSTLLHVLVCAALLWAVARPPKQTSLLPQEPGSYGPLEFHRPKWLQNAADGSLGKHGSSGGNNPLPPTAGELAPPSRSPLVSLHLADSRPHPLNVPVAVYDPKAPEITSAITGPGLPWMKDRNNSEGRGEHGIGVGKDQGMGIGPEDGVGVADGPEPYAHVATQVICRVCPDPLYSEEARKTKLQGSVLLAVLVAADGRAQDVRILRGIGMGLDENAVQAVRTWQFIPARDSAHRPIATWIKVETMFRLF